MLISTKEPRRTGLVTRMDVPLNRYLGAAFEQGVEDSAFSSIAHMTENFIYSEGNKLSPEEANKKYAVEGLNFQTPVYESVARMMQDRHRRRLDREALMESASTFSGRWWGGLGVGVLASFTNPLDFALNFTPVVGSEKAAAMVGKSAFRQKIGRGLVTEEALRASKVPLPMLAGALMEGAAGQAIAEVPLKIYKNMNLEHYTLADSALNIVAGSVLGGGIHLGVRGAARLLRSLNPETRRVLFEQAVEQFVSGQEINVHKFVELDEAKIRERVAFDVGHARQEAALNINDKSIRAQIAREAGDPIVAAAIRMPDGEIQVGPAHFLMEGAATKGSEDGFVTVSGKFLTRRQASFYVDAKNRAEAVERGEMLPEDDVTNEAQSEHFDYFMEDDLDLDAYGRALQEGTESPEQGKRVLNRFRKIFAERQEAFFDRADIAQKIEAERQRRIQAFVDQRRAEYEPGKEFRNEALAEIDRQKGEGRILHPDDALKWGFTREDMQKTETLLKEDIEALKKGLGIEDEMLDPEAEKQFSIPKKSSEIKSDDMKPSQMIAEGKTPEFTVSTVQMKDFLQRHNVDYDLGAMLNEMFLGTPFDGIASKFSDGRVPMPELGETMASAEFQLMPFFIGFNGEGKQKQVFAVKYKDGSTRYYLFTKVNEIAGNSICESGCFMEDLVEINAKQFDSYYSLYIDDVKKNAVDPEDLEEGVEPVIIPLREIPKDWVVTVQADVIDNGKKIPSGYVQIDDPTIGPDGANIRSSSPESLKEAGFHVPDVDFKSLPQGKYTIKEAYDILGAKPLPTPEELALIRSIPEAEINMIDAAVDCITKNIT